MKNCLIIMSRRWWDSSICVIFWRLQKCACVFLATHHPKNCLLLYTIRASKSFEQSGKRIISFENQVCFESIAWSCRICEYFQYLMAKSLVRTLCKNTLTQKKQWLLWWTLLDPWLWCLVMTLGRESIQESSPIFVRHHQPQPLSCSN